MKLPLRGNSVLWLDTVGSTQEELRMRINDGVVVLAANEQIAGRGRLGRQWYSPPRTALSVSIALHEYVGWPKPELLGMAVALAAAEAFDLSLAWPNDLMLNRKKVGGVLAEIGADKLPIVGIGINLSAASFPAELSDRATSILLERNEQVSAFEALASLLAAIEQVPEPHEFSMLAEGWSRRDMTRGKKYACPDGRISIAQGVADNGHLIANCGDEVVTVPSAEAWFG